MLFQKVNHFPRAFHLTRKDFLKNNIDKYRKLGGPNSARSFHFIPRTFVLPAESAAFHEAFQAREIECARTRMLTGGVSSNSNTTTGGNSSSSSSGSGMGGDDDDACVPAIPLQTDLPSIPGTSPNGDNSGDSKCADIASQPAALTMEAQLSTAPRRNVWIVKPTNLSRGRGIFVTDKLETVPNTPSVVQEYIADPLLINNRKFDLRLYVLVTSFEPLEAYIYEEGFARLSMRPYSMDNLTDTHIHLTNSSIQQKKSGFTNVTSGSSMTNSAFKGVGNGGAGTGGRRGKTRAEMANLRARRGYPYNKGISGAAAGIRNVTLGGNDESDEEEEEETSASEDDEESEEGEGEEEMMGGVTRSGGKKRKSEKQQKRKKQTDDDDEGLDDDENDKDDDSNCSKVKFSVLLDRFRKEGIDTSKLLRAIDTVVIKVRRSGINNMVPSSSPFSIFMLFLVTSNISSSSSLPLPFLTFSSLCYYFHYSTTVYFNNILFYIFLTMYYYFPPMQSLMCVQNRIGPQTNAFEVFGYDILIDSQLKPWLIEVNASPSFNLETPIDREIKPRMVADALTIVDPLPFDRAYLARLLAYREKTGHWPPPPTPLPGMAGPLPASPFRMSSTSSSSVSSTDTARWQLCDHLTRLLNGRTPRVYGQHPPRLGGFRILAPNGPGSPFANLAKFHEALVSRRKKLFMANKNTGKPTPNQQGQPTLDTASAGTPSPSTTTSTTTTMSSSMADNQNTNSLQTSLSTTNGFMTSSTSTQTLTTYTPDDLASLTPMQLRAIPNPHRLKLPAII